MGITLSRALYFRGIATAAYTTVPQYRYGQWLDPAAFLVIGGFAVPYGTAALMVFLHWAKVVLVAAIVSLWRRKLRAAAAVVGAICLGLAALSIWNSMGLLALNRTERVTTSDVVAQRDADLRAEMKAIVERLALIGWRPLATVTAEIAAERRQHAWESTSECSKLRPVPIGATARGSTGWTVSASLPSRRNVLGIVKQSYGERSSNSL